VLARGYGCRGQLRRKCTTPTRPNARAPSMYHAGKVTAAAAAAREGEEDPRPLRRGSSPRQDAEPDEPQARGERAG
jgi:hypothetical protein